MKPVIAVDGHAGSGKGTISKKIARSFGLAYLDSGLLFRIAGFLNLEVENFKKISIQDLIFQINSLPFNALRSEEISAKASVIAKNSEIRKKIKNLIREFAENPGPQYMGSIIDGRDIGTSVIPEAICKLFFTADIKIRAKRRFKTLRHTNSNLTLQEVLSNMESRDKQDSSRSDSPLTFSDQYILIDTSNDSIRRTFIKVSKIVEKSLISAVTLYK